MLKFKPIKPKKLDEKQAYSRLAKQINDRLSKIKCPDHHQTPKIELSPDGKITLIVPCCEKLKELVETELGKGT